MLEPHLARSPLLLGCEVWTLRSRWQPLPHLGPGVWMKRDDELSFSVSGSKFRKLISLSQSLRAGGSKHWLSWGSQRSAFLLALMQEARAQQAALELFLLRSTPWREQGTDQLFRLWLDGLRIHWMSRAEWPDVARQVARYAEEQPPPEGEWAIIPEGGDCAEALPGALTLAWEIVVQEERLGIRLDEVCLEAGTGLTAQALICGLGYLGRQLAVEVLLCAGDEAGFAEGLNLQRERCERLFGEAPAWLPPFRCHRPPTARSYGAVNQQVWSGLTGFACATGCLLDPLYGAKLHLWYRARPGRPGQSLWIHGGGGLSVLGYPRIPLPPPAS